MYTLCEVYNSAATSSLLSGLSCKGVSTLVTCLSSWFSAATSDNVCVCLGLGLVDVVCVCVCVCICNGAAAVDRTLGCCLVRLRPTIGSIIRHSIGSSACASRVPL